LLGFLLYHLISIFAINLLGENDMAMWCISKGFCKNFLVLKNT